MKCLVLGGCGFIGSHTCDALTREGHNVVVYDVYQDPNCPYAFCSPDGEINTLDWMIKEVDRVYNFAGVLGTSSSFNYVSEIVKVNVNFAVKIMELCLHSDTELISVGVPPAMWLNPYSITKSCMLQFSKMFYAEGLKGTTLIPYNIYGERQVLTKTEKLIPAVIHNILNNQPTKVYGGGKQVIDLMYVKDFANYVAQLEHLGADYIHVGTGDDITVLEVVKAIYKKMETELNIEWCGTRKGEAEEVYVVSPTGVAKDIILTDLTLGLDNTIRWYREFTKYYEEQNIDTFHRRVSILKP